MLGAIVSPTDAVAATTIAQRLGVPRRIVTVLKGESLVNDATGSDLIIFLTFCVILATLVVQGLSLPLLIRALSLEDDHIGEKEETHDRIKVADAALERLEELKEEDWVREDTAERVQGLYNYRRNRFASRFDGDPDGVEERSAAYQRLMVELLFAQRQRLIRMRDDGKIGDEVMHRIERDLDLEESRLGV